MNGRRRPSAGQLRRKAQHELIEEYVRDTPPPPFKTKPMIDSKTTLATPCPYDATDIEETLP